MNLLSWLGRCSRKAGFDFKFPIGPLNDHLRVSETLERQLMLASRTGEVDRNKCIWGVFLFDRNLDATGIARNRDQEGVENFVCFDGDPGKTREWSFRRHDRGLSGHPRLGA